MPCHPARARELLKSGRAVKRWFKGIFAIKLLDREGGDTQDTVVAIDPGSKREGLTVKSKVHTYLNLQAEAVDWVKEKLETRRNMRRARRFRKTPCRQNRKNRTRGGLPPSTRARWQLKLRLLNWLAKMFPVAQIVVEDIAARTLPGLSGWNGSFSPLEVGKQWFYAEIQKRWPLEVYAGFETKAERDRLGLAKSKNKLAETFDAHCVDSFALANLALGGDGKLDNRELLIVTPLNFIRRQLHKLQPAKGGKRQKFGGTQCGEFKKGAIVKHIKRGIHLIGGFTKGYLSLNSVNTGQRVIKAARKQDLVHLAFNSFAVRAAQA
jgi:hypothetical protein